MRNLLKERFQQLAGIKPLYEVEKEKMSKEEEMWDVKLSLSKAEVKILSPKEYQERVEKKMEILKDLNEKGAFKKDWSEEAFEEWIADNYLWKKVKKQFKK
tara:strand:- start:183 stop:485 length:303 start_codon:yes stop_codon:yes gene_type:complete